MSDQELLEKFGAACKQVCSSLFIKQVYDPQFMQLQNNARELEDEIFRRIEAGTWLEQPTTGV